MPSCDLHMGVMSLSLVLTKKGEEKEEKGERGQISDNVWTNCLRNLNVSSMYTLGKCPLAPSDSALQSVWIVSFMEEIGFPLGQPLEINCDNEAAIAVVNGGELPFKRSKHMNVKYHKLREYVNANEIAVVKVSSKNNLADQFPGLKVLGLTVFSFTSVLQKMQKAGSHLICSQDHVKPTMS